jgi:hypothetical protein
MGRKAKKTISGSRAPPLRVAHRKNAAEHYRYFFEASSPIERFPKLPGLPPGRLLKFK